MHGRLDISMHGVKSSGERGSVSSSKQGRGSVEIWTWGWCNTQLARNAATGKWGDRMGHAVPRSSLSVGGGYLIKEESDAGSQIHREHAGHAYCCSYSSAARVKNTQPPHSTAGQPGSSSTCLSPSSWSKLDAPAAPRVNVAGECTGCEQVCAKHLVIDTAICYKLVCWADCWPN